MSVRSFGLLEIIERQTVSAGTKNISLANAAVHAARDQTGHPALQLDTTRILYSPKDETSCRILVRPDGAPIIYLNGAQTVHTDEPCVLCGEKIDCGEKEVRRESCRCVLWEWEGATYCSTSRLSVGSH